MSVHVEGEKAINAASIVAPHPLEVIANYIAKDSSKHALLTMRRLRAGFAEIAKHPQLYRLRPELAPDARIAPIGSYIILFRIRDNTVRIERVVHGSRDLVRILAESEH